MEMNFTNFIHNIFIIERNKTESSMTACDFVIGQHGFFDFAELFKICSYIFQTCGSWQSSNKYLFGSHHQFGVGFPRHSHFGFD